MCAWKGLSILAALLLFASAAAADNYFEDFDTKEFCDEAFTTGWWDTILGEIKPWEFNPYLASAYPATARIQCMDRAGNILFLGSDNDPALHVLDISDPFALWGLIEIPTTYPLTDIKVHGNALIAAANGWGLHLFDITEPGSPLDLGPFPGIADARRLAIHGDLLYIAAGITGLHVYDISDPFSPAFLDFWETGGLILDVAVTDEYVYVAVEGEGLYVLSQALGYLGQIFDFDGYHRVEVDYPRAYLGDFYGKVHVADVSDPTLPAISYTAGFGGGAIQDIALDGGLVYACNDLGAQVVDWTDLDDPRFLTGHFDSWALSLLPYGEFCFVGDFWDGMAYVGMAQRLPADFGDWLDYGADTGVYDIAYQENFAYVAYGGMRVLDLEDPWNPVFRGTASSGGIITGVAVEGDYAYTPAWGAGLEVHDISDPNLPSLVATVPWSLCHPTAILKDGPYAYVMAWEGFKVYDVSDPLAPFEVAFLPGGWSGWHSLKLEGDYLYATMHGGGLVIIEVSDPTTPVVAGTYPGFFWEIAIHGDYAYLAADLGGVEVLSLMDPASPISLGSVPTPHAATAIDLAGNLALVSTAAPGMVYLDLIDPAAPALLPGIDLSGNDYGGSWEISDYGGFFYFGVDSLGLGFRQLFEFNVDKIDVEFISEPIDEGPEEIEKLRFEFAEDQGWIGEWSAKTDEGNDFEIIQPGGWQPVLPGSELRWKCLIPPEDLLGGPPPSCGWLDISWLYREPIIQSITDVPDDEGLFIDVIWQRSARDFEDEPEPIVHYEVWRRISDEYRWSWTSLASVDAAAQDIYTAPVPTPLDSTMHEEGLFVYRVTAHLTDPSEFFASPPDSGVSVDNIVPDPPSNLAVDYHPDDNELTWEASDAPDLLFYSVYADTVPDFTPSDENLLGVTFDLDYSHDGGLDWSRYLYKVSATDDAWQESEAVGHDPVHVYTPPARFALHQNLPNPFNPMTKILFEVPEEGGHVRLSVYDVNGRLMRRLIDEHYDSGRYEAEWRGTDARGRSLPSGVYFYRLDAGEFSDTKKMVLVK